MDRDFMLAQYDVDELHTEKQKLEVNKFSESRRRNLAAFTAIWYCDTDIVSDEQHQQTQIKLRESINFIVSFNNTTECKEYIRQAKKEKIILIVSNKTGRELLQNVHDSEQVVAIYVYNYHTNEEEDNGKLWREGYQKVKAILTTPSELINKIDQDQNKRERNERVMSTSIIPAAWIDNDKTDEKERTHNKLDGNYLWSRLFIEALVRLESKYMIGALDDCINLCHELYIGNDVQCTKISTFKETYKPSDAVWWYTKEKFIYELLNKALRIQDIDTVFTFRFLIYDICEQLDNEQVNNFLKLAEEPVELASKKIVNSWRGQQMSVEEFEKLRHSEGQYISINSFFSTSKDKQVALIFSESIDNKISVLFEIESDICSVVSRPFADVTNLSLFFYEEEILFMTSAVFKIMSVHYDDEIDHIWIIKLILCDERDTQLNKILRELIDEILPRKTNFMSIGHVLMRMGLHDKAEQFYQRHLKTLPSDDKASFIQAYMNLTVLAEAKEDHHLAISHWKTVIDMTMNQFPTVHNSMQEILYSVNNCLARTIQQSDYDKMFQFIQKSHLERLATVGHDHLETANSYALFSYISRVQGKLDEALKNLNIGLEIALKVLTENHPRLGELYEAIGDLHASKKDYNLALLSYKKALLIKSTSLPNYHADITKLRDTIAAIHEQHIEN